MSKEFAILNHIYDFSVLEWRPRSLAASNSWGWCWNPKLRGRVDASYLTDTHFQPFNTIQRENLANRSPCSEKRRAQFSHEEPAFSLRSNVTSQFQLYISSARIIPLAMSIEHSSGADVIVCDFSTKLTQFFYQHNIPSSAFVIECHI